MEKLSQIEQEEINAHSCSMKASEDANLAKLKKEFQKNVSLFFVSSGTPFYRSENKYFSKIFKDMQAFVPFAIIPTRQRMNDIMKNDIVPEIKSKIHCCIRAYSGL